MTRLRKWVCDHFLPTYAKDLLYKEINRLNAELASKESLIQRLEAYIDGIQDCARIRAIPAPPPNTDERGDIQ